MTAFTTAQVAEKLDTNARTLRKFLRADAKSQGTADALPGKGSRYSIEGKQIAPLKKRFKAWTAAEAEARAARAAKVAEDAAQAVEVDDAEVDTEPTDAELEAIDAD